MMSAGETPAPASVRLTSSTAGDIVVITVDGVLDATTRQQFADHLAQAGTSIILDLAGATFMDSRALGLIIHHWQASQAADGKFALVGVDYRRAKSMWITGLAKVLPLYDDLDEALAALT